MFATMLQNQEADQELRRAEVDLLREELKLSRANMAKVHQLYIEEKAEKAKETEARRLDDQSTKKDEHANRVFRSMARMSPGEDLYSAITRFERSMMANGTDRFKWVEGLEYLLEGKHINNYFAHVDSFPGNFLGLKALLLNYGGFGVHDCVETVLHQFRPGGSLSATQWAMQVSHKIITIWNHAPEVKNLVSSDAMKTLSDCLASYFVLAPMTREGQTCVFSTNPPNARERILAYENFMAPFNKQYKRITLMSVLLINPSLVLIILNIQVSVLTILREILILILTKAPTRSF